jgi:hypothetical protein
MIKERNEVQNIKDDTGGNKAIKIYDAGSAELVAASMANGFNSKGLC